MTTELLQTLEEIQRRVLWLATSMIHHANHVRPNLDGAKVGGHQASSASVVTIMTALYFHFLQQGDRIAIKPHASPVFHAIQYLLGQLPREYLTTLRSYKGLQAYPSRSKDPDLVDFSTGSVGLGVVAPAFAALAQKYAQAHFGTVSSNRFIALAGDAEMDEGNVWEAILDEALEGLDNLLWVVDLNRQSLDRVVPGIRAARLKRIFAGNGWRVLEAKYGRHLQALFALPNGELLRQAIDDMNNQQYQALIRLPGEHSRSALIEQHPALESVLAAVSDAELPSVLANLGGHDLGELLRVLKEAEQPHNQPTILFAYTIKGWGLPIAGHPLNHSMLLTNAQMEEVRQKLGICPGEEWERFAPDSAAGRHCAAVAQRLYPATNSSSVSKEDSSLATRLPATLNLPYNEQANTQETLGRLLYRLADMPEIAARLVTSSPDVSVSTNLAGWVNKRGAFKLHEEPEYDSEPQQALKWKRGPRGQHVELGISEMNLFLLLGMFGLSAELSGQLLVPIGTLYDPFVCRGLDALIYALYSGAKFIFAGTPSGITLSPEGGAHQSTITPSIGTELPKLRMFEPCFAREVEWALLESIRACFDREHGYATYLRLSTRTIDQRLLEPTLQQLGENALRQQMLAGGYRLRDWRSANQALDQRYVVQIAASGALIPEACAAAEYLWSEGVAANVLNLTSPRTLFESWRTTITFGASPNLFDWLILPGERNAPIVTVQDGASHALAWLGSVFGTRVYPLGVDDFGQSGSRDDLYRHFNLDAEAIAEAAFSALDETTPT
ncbi:MAG: 1-deoxy-D-xylulose-5-phosphate synthase N-terminal domain-containing protein [Caldilineaceae bacterium]